MGEESLKDGNGVGEGCRQPNGWRHITQSQTTGQIIPIKNHGLNGEEEAKRAGLPTVHWLISRSSPQVLLTEESFSYWRGTGMWENQNSSCWSKRGRNSDGGKKRKGSSHAVHWVILKRGMKGVL